MADLWTRRAQPVIADKQRPGTNLGAGLFGPNLGKLRFEPGEIVGVVDPFFTEAASGTEIARYLDGAEKGSSGHDIVAHAKGANLARYPKDFGRTTLRADFRVSHGALPIDVTVIVDHRWWDNAREASEWL